MRLQLQWKNKKAKQRKKLKGIMHVFRFISKATLIMENLESFGCQLSLKISSLNVAAGFHLSLKTESQERS